MADPRAIPAPKPSTRAEIGGVLRGLVGLPRLALDWRSLPRPATTTARPVLVVPGFMTGDPATAVLRAFLTGLGHPTYGWGLGRNRGDLRKLLPVFDRRLHEIAERHGTELRERAKAAMHARTSEYLVLDVSIGPRVFVAVPDAGVALTLRYLCSPYERRASAQLLWEDILDAFAAREDIDFAYPTTRFYDNVREGKPGAKAKAEG
ncbi:MAG: hypothetical protein KC457_27770 [Myxococcales bacterium]|nr:hypothetical protein [Myxococcales bacterium]